MKSIGRCGSSSEYTIFTGEHGFIHQGVWYLLDLYNGRCYRMQEPGGVHSRLEREGRMARKRISAALYAQLLKECETNISEAEKEKASQTANNIAA